MNKFTTIFFLIAGFLASQEDTSGFTILTHQDDLVKAQEDTIKLKGLKYNYFNHNALVFNEYLSINGKGYNTTNFRYKTPLLKGNWIYRVDVPIVSSEFTGTNGLGDIYTSLSYMPYLDEKQGYWIRGRLFIPTATDARLGMGKWSFSPTIGYGRKFSKTISFLASYEQRFSFAGDSDRTDLNMGILDTSLNFSKNNYWVSLNPSANYDFNTSHLRSFNVALEMGRSVSKTSSLYVRPSTAIGDTRYYDFGIEFGITTSW